MRVARSLLALALVGSLAGCITYKSDERGLTYLRIGETKTVGGPRVTPLRVISDSRCPAKVQCVWAGEVRIAARIELGSGAETRELVMGQPASVADGTLELVETYPERKPDQKIYPDEYLFGFRFSGGL